MTQYPPQYNYSTFGAPDPLAPARRSAVLMYILGAIGVIGGFCFGGMGLALPDFMSQPQFSQAIHQSNATIGEMQASMIFFGVVCLIGGILLIVLGTIVRRGRTGSIITAIVLDGLALLVCVFILLSSLVMADHGGAGANLASAICMLTLPILLLIVLLMWLIQALRNAGAVQSAYVNPYWQYPPDYHPFPPAPAPPGYQSPSVGPPPEQIPPPPNFEPPTPPAE